MAQNDDTVDVRAYISGEREALDRLVIRHKDRIFSLCYRLLGDYDEAEECTQETFVKVFRSIGSFRLESSFSTWLYSIAVNTCKNRRNSADYRFWRRVFRLGQDSDSDDAGDGPDMDIADQGPSPLAQLAEKEREALLQSAMNTLSYEHRMVIVLRHVKELSYEEISKITGYNLGTLKSTLARARLRLQKAILDVYRENPDGML